MKAENSEDLRLYGELLTANIHLIQPGMKSVEVTNYYDGSTLTIPLDVKLSPSKNAQHYFKKYGKSKTAIKEKQIQLDENEAEIKYLESVLSFLENTDDVAEIEASAQSWSRRVISADAGRQAASRKRNTSLSLTATRFPTA